ncbi:low density lipoprotein receptor adapter protein 1-A-like [Actinia tenebrosa]|uniref:Low density lipoprotein receptor adapter protein 1-A-like n=1 Tax=Actinia tenebrosa TaxID=6105 RepID=A0A6P8IT35_ACTTE|nr:low density lipoprotein receptor adapter protein 1-A-like [Actinia tenebrosa]
MLKLFTCRSDTTVIEDDEKDYTKVDLDKHRPTYKVRYLGCEELYKPDLTQMCETVDDIYTRQRSRFRKLTRCSLVITKEALILRDPDKTEDEERGFSLKRILYCGVYGRHQKLFFYNYQFGVKGDLVNCHALLCETKEEAKSLAKVISKAFRIQAQKAHQEDLENRKLHARGLSQSSLSEQRKYFDLKNSRGTLSASEEFQPKGKGEKDTRIGRSYGIHDWEITDSSRDDTSMSSFNAEIRDIMETSSITNFNEIEEESSSVVEQVQLVDGAANSEDNSSQKDAINTTDFSFNIKDIEHWSLVQNLYSTDV